MNIEVNAKTVITGVAALLGSGGLWSGYEAYKAYEILHMDRDILQCEVAAIKTHIVKKEPLKNDCWKIPVKKFRGEQ